MELDSNICTRVRIPTYLFRFRYKHIYSVLFAIGNNKDGFYVKDEELCTQITICANNNLIPCLMPLNDTDFSPALEESHLIHSDTREQVELIINKEPQLMSQWEKLDFSIQIVREALKCQGAKIIKYTSIPDIEPNIWFEKNGQIGFVIVLCSDDSVGRFSLSSQTLNLMRRYEGFYTFLSMPGKYRGEGVYSDIKRLRLIPISELAMS